MNSFSLIQRELCGGFNNPKEITLTILDKPSTPTFEMIDNDGNILPLDTVYCMNEELPNFIITNKGLGTAASPWSYA